MEMIRSGKVRSESQTKLIKHLFVFLVLVNGVLGIGDDGDDRSFTTYWGSTADGLSVKWDTDMSYSGSTDMYMTFTAYYRTYW